MNIVKARAEILFLDDQRAIDEIYARIETAGRTCYKSTSDFTPESSRKFAKKVVEMGHEAMLEHASVMVRFTVDRGVSHEIVRHRLASFAQESTRYCVAGDTVLTFSNPHVHMNIAELYDNVTYSKNGSWKRMKIRQYNETTGELQTTNIKHVFFNGIKECIRIKTKLGYELVCTPAHAIRTPDGYKCASELNDGDLILVNGTYALYQNYDWLYDQSITKNKTFIQIAKEFGFNVSTVKKWARKLGIPKKGTGYFHVGHAPWNKGVADERQVAALREYHHCGRRKDKILKEDTKRYQKYIGSSCEICCTEANLEVHHIDNNHENNNPENLMTVCESCHGRVHSGNLLVAYADKIVSIESVGTKKVYDIEVDSEFSNYVANGVVVHNCNYSKDKFDNEITFIKPCFWDYEDPLYKKFITVLSASEVTYMHMVSNGASPQEARSVLPNSLKTEVVMTANIREFRHFFRLRAACETGMPHPQMLEVAVPLFQEMSAKLPELFSDIVIPPEVLKAYGKS